VVADPDGIEAVIHSARSLFAPILPKLEESDQRARQNHSAPPGSRHRLPELIHALEETLRAVDRGEKEIDILSLLELNRAVSLYERWRADPAVARMLPAAQNSSTFHHDQIVLATASALVDAGLGAELHEAPEGRAPDLRVSVALNRHFAVEVKTPRPLQRRPNVASDEPATRRLVVDSLEKARDQLLRGTPGLLLVGGAFWSGDFPLLVEEGKRLWADKGPRRNHIAGVIFASSTIQYVRRPGSTEPFDWSQVDWIDKIVFRWVGNPHYDGDLKIAFDDDLTKYDLAFKP
jgi:hypothetical protein